MKTIIVIVIIAVSAFAGCAKTVGHTADIMKQHQAELAAVTAAL